jgi:hypothetical protein
MNECGMCYPHSNIGYVFYGNSVFLHRQVYCCELYGVIGCVLLRRFTGVDLLILRLLNLSL